MKRSSRKWKKIKGKRRTCRWRTRKKKLQERKRKRRLARKRAA
jgi:hypothetical protein